MAKVGTDAHRIRIEAYQREVDRLLECSANRWNLLWAAVTGWALVLILVAVG